MTITKEDLHLLHPRQLKKIAHSFDIPYTDDIEVMVQRLYEQYCESKRYLSYRFIRQLGREGVDGKTFLALDKNQKEVAIKLFRHDKSAKRIEREAKFQIQAADKGISPRVIEYDGEGKYIAMEKLDVNLYDCFCKQHGELTISQQKAVVKLFRRLDECGIFHGDPNPLNIMKKRGKWYMIDYGFAKPINERIRFRYGPTPNLKYMTLGFLIQLTTIKPDTSLTYIRKMVKEVSLNVTTVGTLETR